MENLFDPNGIIFMLAVLIVSVIAHEISHGYVAEALGDSTARYAGRLTLNPLKHIDPIGSIIVPLISSLGGFVFGWAKPVPYNPYNLKGGKWGPALVAAAGPLMNIFIALFFGFVLRSGLFDQFLNTLSATLIVQIILVNTVLALFNLIPVAPFDGSKILFAILPYKYKYIEDFLNEHQFLILFIFIFFIWESIAVPILQVILRLITGA